MILEGSRCLVTGGAIRVGRAICLALARQGASVALTYRTSAGPAKELVRELRGMGADSFAVWCDQSDPASIQIATQQVLDRWGSVQVLVNNASEFVRMPLETVTLEEWDRSLNTNLRGPWLWCQALVPGMQSHGSGVIVNLVDIAAERPYPGFLPYCAAKAGLVSLTRGLARALGPSIRVNAVAPGTVEWPEGYDTEKQERTISRTPLQRIGTPDDAAAAVLYLIEAEFVTGVVLPVDGGRSVV